MSGVLAGFVMVGLASARGGEVDLDRLTPVEGNRQIPVADFFRPVYMASPTINRAGTHIAAMVSGGSDRYQLMVIDREEGTQDRLGGAPHTDIYTPHWLSDDRISYRLVTDKFYEVALMAAQVGRLSQTYPIYQYGGARVIGVPYEKKLRPLIWSSSDDRGLEAGVLELDARRKSGSLINLWDDRARPGGWSDVREMNARSIEKSFPAPATGQVWSYRTDRNENLAVALTVEEGVPKANYWTGKEWELSALDIDKWEIETLGNRTHEVVVRADRSEGEPGALHFADLDTGVVGDLIFKNSQYDFDGYFFRDPKSRNLAGLMYEEAAPRVVWFDEKYAALQKTLDASFRGQVVRLMSGNDKATVFLLRVESDRHPRAYYVIDLEKRSLDLVAESRPWLDPERMSPRLIIKYKTADGKELDAYLTMPEGASKENPPPLVVMPHGGLWTRGGWGFDVRSQFMASRGYAVLQPNYRGSPGYNWMFPFEDRWDFLKMHDDVTQATRQLIASGRVDGNRVAIAGTTFGGYLALMGAVHEPDLYRCVVTYAGIFDWGEMMKMENRLKNESTNHQVLLRRLGDPKDDPEKFERISPGRRVAGITMPVFVAHGKEDRVVSVGESRRLIAELKHHGIEHESLLLGGEAHGAYNIESSVEFFSAVEAFLAKHL